MWYCPQCGEELEDTFDACWNCGTGEDGIVNYDFKPAEPPSEDVGNVIDVAPHSAQLMQPLEFSHVSFGMGKMAVPFLLMSLFGSLACAVLFSWLEAEDGTARRILLWASSIMAAMLGWNMIATVVSTPLKVCIADKVTVRYLLHTREWESHQLRTIRFFQSVRFLWVIALPIPVRRYRLANLTLGEGEEVEFIITPEEERELRAAFGPDEFD